MPGTIRVDVCGARGLPVMDKSAETTDAFVEVRFANTSFKTAVCPKSLSPRWENEHFVFEAEDIQLQDECIQFRVMDYDTYSANDAIGRIYMDLSPLVAKATRLPSAAAQLTAWLPIMDPMQGIRGDLQVCIALELFVDRSIHRRSSCGVQVFSCSWIPSGWELVKVNGFVDDLLTGGDPEYQWLDKIRSPRATNEARQVLFRSLGSQLVRKIARQALSLGANAVIGYRLSFDLERESSGLVSVRAIGTAVCLRDRAPGLRLTPIPSDPSEMQEADVKAKSPLSMTRRSRSTSTSEDADPEKETGDAVMDGVASRLGRLSRARKFSIRGHEEPLDDALQLTGPVGEGRNPDLPFFTIDMLPGLVLGVGGLVSAKSVRVLERLEEKENAEPSDVRCGWWVELREEILSHVRTLACNAVLGYREEVFIRKDVCILSACGTAVSVHGSLWSTSPRFSSRACSFCHVSYSEVDLPFSAKLDKCSMCSEGFVSDMVLATCEPPAELIVPDSTSLVQVPLIRRLQHNEEEELAKELSDLLPFVEHQLYNGLLSQLSSLHPRRNGIFSLKTTIAIGDGIFIAVLTGTAVCLFPLATEEIPSSKGVLSPSIPKSWQQASASSLWPGKDKETNDTPFFCLQVWRGVLEATDEGDTEKGSPDADRMGLNLKTKTDWLLRNTLFKFRRRQQKLKQMREMPVLVRNLMLTVGVVEEGQGEAFEVELGLCGMVSAGGGGREAVHSPPSSVMLSSLPRPPPDLAPSLRCLGRCDLTFIRETASLKEVGGLEAFVQLALGEVFHAVRCHVSSLGGVALVSMRFTLMDLAASVHKNQAQCLLGIIGDILVPDEVFHN